MSDFYKSKSSKDGLYNVCKDCDKKRCLEYYKSNSEYIINSLDNLQPLWALENLSKSNKI